MEWVHVGPGRVGCVRVVEAPPYVENVIDGALHRRRRVTGVEESSRRWLLHCMVGDPCMENLIILHRGRGTG